jgi:hypothetical protein
MSQSTSNSSEVKQLTQSEVKKKKSFWENFYTFLAMGGFILVLMVLAGLALGIGLLVQKC